MIISLEVVRANENAFVNGVHFNLRKSRICEICEDSRLN